MGKFHCMLFEHLSKIPLRFIKRSSNVKILQGSLQDRCDFGAIHSISLKQFGTCLAYLHVFYGFPMANAYILIFFQKKIFQYHKCHGYIYVGGMMIRSMQIISFVCD